MMHCFKIILSVLTVFLSQSCLGQLVDSFSDGDLSASPAWTGDSPKFEVNSNRLKLMAPSIAGGAYLSTPSQALYNATWEFYLQMDFTPSSANYAKIYLVSDQAALSEALNGYFVKAGNTARDVCLYRQTGNTELKIIDGLDDRLNTPTVKVKIRVTRNATGMWQLFTDAGVSGNYMLEGTVTDDAHQTSAFFGIQCIFTSTRSDKFWFDDFNVTGVAVPDMTPPGIQGVSVTSAKKISVVFSEEVDKVAAETLSHYNLNSIGSPVSASLNPDQRAVSLEFSMTLVNGITYRMDVSGVYDIAGNTMRDTSVSVLFFQPAIAQSKDIIFTEILPDPSPQIALPAAEFIEIYNRSKKPFDLAGWELSDGSSTARFPPGIILPGDYWIITNASSTLLFSLYGTTIGLADFPTLNNDGDHLTLKDTNNQLIDSVNFALEDYRDEDKQEGGWSLEIIDPENLCGEQENWTASEDMKGGTPGKQNSVLANKPDRTAPVLLSVFPESSTRITAVFNEKLDPESLSPDSFTLRNRMSIERVFFDGQNLRTIALVLKDGLVPRQVYTLDVSGIMDCSGNENQPATFNFGLPESPDSLDLVINEILFNPRPGGADFVEVFNRSEKYVDMKNWKLCNLDQQTPVNMIDPFLSDMLLAPGGFLVFTTDPAEVKFQYSRCEEKNLVKTKLPGLPDDTGSIAIMDDQGKFIDALYYSREWHSAFIKDEEGVSLERISYGGPTNLSDNWASASSGVGFATPGFSNSQHDTDPGPADEDITIVPQIFLPGLNTFEFVEIKYNLHQPGWVANVKIVDQQGHSLKSVANNELLGQQGFFRWDGDREDGYRVRAGYYVVWFEIFNPKGAVKTFRKRVIVASR